jgi:hypothetical protein
MNDGLMAGSQISTLTSIWFTQTTEGQEETDRGGEEEKACWGQWCTLASDVDVAK